MIHYTIAISDHDLEGILTLQAKNLTTSLPDEEALSQGFVTVEHSYGVLKKLNDIEPHIIAKENNKVIGYVLSMTKTSRNDIPVLIPMFGQFDQTTYNNHIVSDYKYITVGQVCVDKDYRGAGVFDHLYNAYKKIHKATFDFAITEIERKNMRSLNAHKRIGFKELSSYTDAINNNWVIVIWDWKSTG